VKVHLESPACASCHRLLDPIGLGLENYDAVGRWRDRDNDAPIDATGDLDGVRFDGPIELGQAIRDHEAFAPCVVRTLARYATGRVEAPGEHVLLDDLSARFAALDYRLQPLLLEVIMSPMFRNAGAPR
jgi:hypothetical protein